jgi:cell surface protein SprA
VPARDEGGRAIRTLAGLVSFAAVAAWVLVGRASPEPAGTGYRWQVAARADTDSVAARLDSLALDAASRSAVRSAMLQGLLVARSDTDSVAARLDSLALDSTSVAADTGLAQHYLPTWRDWRTARSTPRRNRPLGAKFGTYWRQSVEFDTTARTFRVHEQVGGEDVRIPVIYDMEGYRSVRLSRDLERNWRAMVVQRTRQQMQQNRGGLGFNIVVPGGRQSAFTTIFGKPSVDLRVNGQADIKAGFSYRKSDQQVAITGRASQLDPDFKQDLRLGINGTIGDKLRIDVNYDSQNQFDYQNQLKLQYTGYEDEIIQSVEAGNVFLQTPSSLIRGGQSLFGIKSQFQVGGLHLTTVMSQQEGQSNTLNIEGGSEATNFDLKPTDYDESIHFFLSYYFRNRFEDALSDPPNIRVADGFERITEMEVWRLMPTTPEEQNVRQVVAVVDLGEPVDVLSEADAFTAAVLPTNTIDQYDDQPDGEVDVQLRDGDATPGSYLESVKALTASDYQIGKFRKLERGRDYQVDEILGTLSLRSRLQESEALAVAYRFTAGGRNFQVGDFSTDTGGSDGGQNEDKLFLKLIRPVQLRQPAPESDFNPAAWYLELRNIYRLPGRGIQANEFDLQIFYEPPGKTASKTLPGVSSQETLLRQLGLDRVNADQALRPDDVFDYLVHFTIDPGEGTLIFPYLEPFGERLTELIALTGGTDAEQEDLRNLYVFGTLYQEKKANARRDSQHDVFRIRGSYKGSVQDFYDLRAYAGLIPGSVRVASGGTPLQEGTDFTVDYQGGTVMIINPAFLTAGRSINIDYEQNSFFNLQKKTLLGARMDYNLNDRLVLGATLMQMSQKSPIDKFRIGEEPVSNTIWGVDGSFKAEPRWLTRMVDLLPLIQTKERSTFSLSGEFAQLRPNHVETIAFDRTRRELQKSGRDFTGDELGGISYIDDFEGFENTYSLMQPGSWTLSAAPDSIGAIDRGGTLPGTLADSLRTTWRGSFAWYRANANILQEIPAVSYDADAIRPLRINDVFPNRDTRGELVDQLETLDIYFSPSERGPYNYTTDLRGFLSTPTDVWGGITQRLPEGYTDFSLKNIDFVEFVFRPFPENPARDAGTAARLYVDLGSISEDVLPDEKLSNEDGLSLATIGETSVTKWGRTPSATQNSVVDVDDLTSRTEDLGLDGLASYGGDYPPFATEQVHFSNFLDALDPSETDPVYRAEMAKAMRDPSGDDYHYFGNSQYFDNPEFYPSGATFQQRFSRYFAGYELNAFETQNKLATNTSVKRGNSRFPDSEDRNLNSTVDTDNSYFQYELPLSRAVLDSLAQPGRVDDYIVGEITDRDGNGTGWYQARVPVQNFTRQVGEIQDFSLIESIRLWTDGHEVPVTIRFATLELVGSQWQKSTRIPLEHETPADTTASETRLTISSINNEENADLYSPPVGAVVSQTRLATGRVQNAREQSLVLRVENLYPGKQRAVFRTQNTALDLLRYSNIRMFVHMHGRTGDGTELHNLPIDEARSKVRLFVRLGANESNDYYEYEQPLSPSSETAGSSDALWQTAVDYQGQIQDLNSVNILLGALNQLKVTRDRLLFPTDSVFYNVEDGVLVAPDAPDAESFGPPGTRIGIKGTPSLGRVNSIVIGIRNPADSLAMGFEHVLEDVTVWVNELRVAGYDESNGWAGLANVELQLADFARVNANIQTQTDGFGSLSSTLAEREQNNLLNYSVTSEVNVDKFIPERFGWSMPVNVQVQSNTTTPRFAPTRGDVRLSELLAQIDERTDVDEAQKEQLRVSANEEAQTHTLSRSVTARVGKSGSRSAILRHTLDGLSFSWSNSQADGRTPQLVQNGTRRWSSTAAYRLGVRRTRTIRPLFFLDYVPVLKVLGGLRWNLVPQSVSVSGSLNRQLNQTQERPTTSRAGTVEQAPNIVRFPLREQHTFGHTRDFAIQYNPFSFLNLGFDTSTQQNLNAAGVDTLFNTITRDGAILAGYRIEQALAGGLVDSTDLATTWEQELLRVKPFDRVIREALSGAATVRAERHDQRFTGTLRPRLNTIRAIDFINLQDISYTATYGWQNGPIGRNTGASVRVMGELRSGVTLRVQELWRKFGFYRSIETSQREYQAARDREQQDREREKQDRKRREEARKVEAETREKAGKELQAALERAELEAREAGVDLSQMAIDSIRAAIPQPPPLQPEEPDTTGGGGFRVPLPNMGSVARQFVLAVTGIRDVSLTYSGRRGGASSNVGIPVIGADSSIVDVRTPYSLLDAIRGDGVPLRYRFGLYRFLDSSERLVDPSLQVADNIETTDQLQGRTLISPWQSVQLNVTWNVEWTQGQTYTYRPAFDAANRYVGIDTTLTENGSNRSSIWAFGASYLDLFYRQYQTLLYDLQSAGPDATEFGDANGDGRVVLTNATVTEDFRRSFVMGGGRTLDRLRLMPTPLPNWTLTYSGLSTWPIFRSLVTNLTVRHGYTADYSADYATNSSLSGGEPFRTLDLGNRRIIFAIEPYQTGSMRVNERYMPLIGVDVAWKGQVQTNVAFNRSNAYSLSTSNFEVSENRTNEISFTASWQKSGMKIPLFGKRLNNRVSFSLNVARSETRDQRLRLRRALESALLDPNFVPANALEGDNISLVTAHTRLTVSPTIAYQFSNRVTANFTLSYEKFDSEDSRQPSSVTINGNFNIRVSISN